ncbi:hypothetical protein Pfo_010356 [Paulownia fortunei]|nr:hypothetical protein Pfo_010356 [Paulownia fortunei]
MDVYISEEYVVRRRIEKKAAAKNGKNSNGTFGSGGKSSDKDNMSRPPTSAHRFHHQMSAANSGYGDVVFSCFSA